MAKKEEKIEIEREYVIPLRKSWLKAPKHKRANKAVKTIKEFVARHMRVDDRDTRKVKIDIYLNQEIRFRGMKKPPAKIRVKVKKYADKVTVELVNVPEKIKWQMEKEKKYRETGKKVKEERKAKEKKEEEKGGLEEKTKEGEGEKKEEVKKKTEEKTEEKKEDAKEKVEAVKEAGLKYAEEHAKEMKHGAKNKDVRIHRMALKK